MSKAWVYQRPRDVAGKGSDSAPWYVGWYTPDGRRRSKCCGPGKAGRKVADRARQQLEASLVLGTYTEEPKETWDDFVRQYKTILDGMTPANFAKYRRALLRFHELAAPSKMSEITTQAIDLYVAKLRGTASRRTKSKRQLLSAASVNSDLRCLRAAFKKAIKWGYLREEPEITFVAEPEREQDFVSSEDFDRLFACCDSARHPVVRNVATADWWRALLAMLQLYGWRIGAALQLEWESIDFEQRLIRVRSETTKRQKGRWVPLHELLLPLLAPLKPAFDSRVFPHNNRRQLDIELDRIALAAGVKITGFHSFRRGFASENATRLDAKALQEWMGHSALPTTMRYVRLGQRLQSETVKIAVPKALESLRSPEGRKAEGD